MQVCPKCGYVTMDNNDKYCPNCIYKAEYENVDDVSKGLKEMYEEDYEDQLLLNHLVSNVTTHMFLKPVKNNLPKNVPNA